MAKGLAKHNGKAPRSVGANDADVDDGQIGSCRDGMYAALARADRAVLWNHNRRSPVRFRPPLPTKRDPVRVAFSCCAAGKTAARLGPTCETFARRSDLRGTIALSASPSDGSGLPVLGYACTHLCAASGFGKCKLWESQNQRDYHRSKLHGRFSFIVAIRNDERGGFVPRHFVFKLLSHSVLSCAPA